jgi:hypothetical protein
MIARHIVTAIVLTSASATLAAEKPSVSLWDQQLVDKCIEGVNLSSAGATDPNRAAGSVYFKTVTPGSAEAFQVFPLGLPITEGDAATPEKATCDLELRTLAGAGAEILASLIHDARFRARSGHLLRLAVLRGRPASLAFVSPHSD